MLTLLVGGGDDRRAAVAHRVAAPARTSSTGTSRVIPFLHYVDEGVAAVARHRRPGARLRPAPDRAQRGARDAASRCRSTSISATRQHRWLGLRRRADARRALDGLAHGHDHADRAARQLPLHQAERDRPAAARRCCRSLVVIQVVMPGHARDDEVDAQPGVRASRSSPTTRAAAPGRVADLGPALEQWSRKPFFGAGLRDARRGPERQGGRARTQILDDQWLGTLLEIGVRRRARLPVAVRAARSGGCRRCAKASRQALDGWLADRDRGLARRRSPSGMLTFDAFAFVQVTFLAFIMLGLGAAVVGPPRRRSGTSVRPRAALRLARRRGVGLGQARRRPRPTRAARGSAITFSRRRASSARSVASAPQVLGQHRLVAGRVDQPVHVVLGGRARGVADREHAAAAPAPRRSRARCPR